MNKLFGHLDWLIILPVSMLSIMSIITLFGFNANNIPMVSQFLITKHIISIVLGLICVIIMANIDYRSFATLVQTLFFITIGFLILVLIFGNRVNGAKSWIDIGYLNFQPAEFAKAVVVIITAHYFSRYHHKLNSFRYIILSLIPVLFIIFLILLQPDFGSATIVILVWLGMFIFGGVRIKHIFILGLIGLVISASLWIWGFKDYQKDRIFTFLNPTSDPLGSGYNSLQSVKSIISGGMTGVREQIVPVPEVHTDFIFSGFAQQWGFLGISIYFIIILWIISRMIYIALNSQDSFPKMIILGVILCITIQLIINVGMNLGIMPITGVPLPFMSYGGSSMVLYWILIGFVLSIQNHQLSKGTIFMRDSQDIFG